MLKRCFIRLKDGEWQEITDENIQAVNTSFGDKAAEEQHAHMARLHGINGEFEIEVLNYKYFPEIYEVIRKAEGTTAILSDATK